MKNNSLLLAVIATIMLSSCLEMGKRVDGNGNITSENRSIAKADRIRLLGDMDVYISQGPAAVKVETDENIIPYIITELDDNWLEIKSKDGINVHTSKPVKVYVTTPDVKDVNISGSGNVNFGQKFSSSNDISFKISGSGDMRAEINAPKIEAQISGSGNLHISGETKNLEIHIAGSGNYNGPALKAEKAEVNIAGSGDAELYAEDKLKASIAGSGNVKYHGGAVVDSHIAGSGSVVKVQ